MYRRNEVNDGRVCNIPAMSHVPTMSHVVPMDANNCWHCQQIGGIANKVLASQETWRSIYSPRSPRRKYKLFSPAKTVLHTCLHLEPW